MQTTRRRRGTHKSNAAYLGGQGKGIPYDETVSVFNGKYC
jgi:hypothetical protein